MRLGIKLILGFLVVGLTGVALVALIASRATESEFGRFMFDRYHESVLTQLQDYYLVHGGWEGLDVIRPGPLQLPIQPHRQALPPGGPITLADAQGIILVAGHGF